MDLAKQFGTDKTAELEGVWVPCGHTARIKVARQGNPHFMKVMRRLRAPFMSSFRAGNVPDEVALDIYRKALVEAILLDWDGIEENGVPVPYSREAATRLVNTYQEFADIVSQAAQTIENFQAQEDEEVAKNSSGSSRTSKAPLAA